jgi:hypothetical protein
VNQAKPPVRFTQLFQADFELVNEIVARFRILSLPMIGEWRCARAQKLSGHMVAGARRRQFLDQADYRSRIFEQPVLEIERAFSHGFYLMSGVQSSEFDVRLEKPCCVD